MKKLLYAFICLAFAGFLSADLMAQQVSPCTNPVFIECDESRSGDLGGSSNVDLGNAGGPTLCSSTPAGERYLLFTPSTPGTYTIELQNINIPGTIAFGYSLFTCDPSFASWICLGDVLEGSGESADIILNSPLPIYIVVDGVENPLVENIEWQLSISCGPLPPPPPPPTPSGPCESEVPIQCGTSVNGSLSTGNGDFDINDGPGCNATPGNEIVYTFTAPTTGLYNVQLDHNPGSSLLDYGWRVNSCDGTGANWTCLGTVGAGSSENQNISLTAGDQVFLIVDDEDTQASTFSLTVSCAIPPPPAVPTLSQWGLIILSLIMLNVAAIFAVRRFRPTAISK